MHILEYLSREPFAVVGHRGAHGVRPDNTLAAFRYAVEAGADIVEMDVRRTKDGTLILLHERDFKHLIGRAIPPGQLDFAFIREHIRVEGEPIPTLEEALKEVAGRVGVFVEIKEPETTEQVLETLKRCGISESVAVISFWDEALEQTRRLAPGQTTGLIYARAPGRITDAHALGATIVLPHVRLATARANAFAHKLRLRVVSWIINDEETARQQVENGTDGLATDEPAWLVQWREARARTEQISMNTRRS